MSAFEEITVSGLQPRDTGSFDLEWVLALVLLLLFLSSQMFVMYT